MQVNNFVNANAAGILDQVQQTATATLSNFAAQPNALQKMQQIFGGSIDKEMTQKLLTQFQKQDFSDLPGIEIRSPRQLSGANGAFSSETNTIYLSSALLRSAAKSDDLTGVTSVLLEEVGHAIDAKVNKVDTAGDEGDVFQRVVQGQALGVDELAVLQAEDDTTTLVLDGKSLLVEQNSPSDFGINLSSNHYFGSGGNVFAASNGTGGTRLWCTDFAFGRALEKGLINPNSGIGRRIRGNAGQWDDQAGGWSTAARVNSFVVWDPGKGGAGSVGHVAFVERVNANGSFVISEANFGSRMMAFNSRTISPGTPAFRDAKFIHLGSQPNRDGSVALAQKTDFNGDGKSDVLWRHQNGQVHVWLMDGMRRLGFGDVERPGLDWRIAETGDFNGDGKSDVLWRHQNGQVHIWLMDGMRRLGFGDVERPGLDWRIAETGDFNGDGKSDVLWRHQNGQVHTWLMDGMRRLGFGDVERPGLDWRIAGMDDFNGDSKSEFWEKVGTNLPNPHLPSGGPGQGITNAVNFINPDHSYYQRRDITRDKIAETFCNWFAADVLESLTGNVNALPRHSGIYHPPAFGIRNKPHDANYLHTWLNQGGGGMWRSVSAADAVSFANQGAAVVASSPSPGRSVPGHIAIVIPGGSASDVRIAQAGVVNGKNMSLRQGFGSNTSAVKYFVYRR